MPRKINQISELKAKSLKKPGMYPDGAGLYLKVNETGSKSWVYRYRTGPSSRYMGLGAYPMVTLAAARVAASIAASERRQGQDPIDVRKTAKSAPVDSPAVTFEEAAKDFISANETTWHNDVHRRQWGQTLRDYAFPIVGSKPVAEVIVHDIMRILNPIWRTKPETADRLRGRIERILDWAKVQELRSGENPARWRGHLQYLLPARNKKRTVRHHPALSWRDMPKFMGELIANDSISALSLRFVILTASRTSEVTGATWEEIDLNERVWTIPASRMKMRVQHRVPLTTSMLELLENILYVSGNLIFPSTRRNCPLSNMAMLELLRGMRPGFTVHGFRSTFRDWVADATDFRRELAEAALAHTVQGVEAAYQRSDMLDARRVLMTAWGNYCISGESPAAKRRGKVIQFPPKAGSLDK